ncbi:hypothetical protein SAMN04490248_13318 [Salinihabitans flavidus]|uniref:Uncharacterized protein n=1 Tax=Salinihabitans flavidus TaxID=569882 RepID=A0A1H8VS14_9RHOB|nr:hypothetical protein SAMN04490248_13318 [Salinihabitans flavidus]
MANVTGVTTFGRNTLCGFAILDDNFDRRIRMHTVRLGRSGPKREKADHYGDDGNCLCFHGA